MFIDFNERIAGINFTQESRRSEGVENIQKMLGFSFGRSDCENLVDGEQVHSDVQAHGVVDDDELVRDVLRGDVHDVQKYVRHEDQPIRNHPEHYRARHHERLHGYDCLSRRRIQSPYDVRQNDRISAQHERHRCSSDGYHNDVHHDEALHERPPH
uniref:Uncharacterized protein n=1 Tax=Glossina austeni TaxID=7395 RepID=A0A1A9VV33_GLOAU